MKITTKLVLAVFTSTALVFAVNGYLRVQREVVALQSHMVRDARTLGQVLSTVLEDAWRTGGPRRVSQLIADANANTSHLHFRWLPFGATASPAVPPAVEPSRLSALQKGETVTGTARDANGQTSLYLYVPITVDHELPGALELGESLRAVHTYVRQTLLRTLVAWGGMVTLSGGLLLLIIEASNDPGGGACFTVYLPMEDERCPGAS